MNALPNYQNSLIDLREDFPILQQLNRGQPLVYLDSASSTQKPKQVIEAIDHLYRHHYANVHRGVYEFSEQCSALYERTRTLVKQFINASKEQEIIFVRGTTEGINLVARSFGASQWQAEDEVILSEMEHHSNIVPWYELKEKIGIILKVIPVQDNGELDMEEYSRLFSKKTKLVAVTHASNVLGTINPVKKIVEIAHQQGVPVLLDGAQAASHFRVDVKAIDCDFYVFSSHKLYGPSGIGVLYVKEKHVEQMSVYQGGGGMIASVSFDKITYAKAPHKFEAGTPNIEAAIGLQAALLYLMKISMDVIREQESQLISFANHELSAISGLRLLGSAEEKVGVFSFTLDGIHPHDVATVLDHEGIAVRAGHHCAMPLMKRFNVPATVRASLGIYNEEKDIIALVKAINFARGMFA